MVGLGSFVTGVAMCIPAMMYLWPAARGGESANVEVKGAMDLPPGGSTMLQVGSKAVIVVRHRSGFKAFSAACTHLGCLVKWSAAQKLFLCPCHAATFDENGRVVSGPPPAPLPEFKVKEVAGKVFVSAA